MNDGDVTADALPESITFPHPDDVCGDNVTIYWETRSWSDCRVLEFQGLRATATWWRDDDHSMAAADAGDWVGRWTVNEKWRGETARGRSGSPADAMLVAGAALAAMVANGDSSE